MISVLILKIFEILTAEVVTVTAKVVSTPPQQQSRVVEDDDDDDVIVVESDDESEEDEDENQGLMIQNIQFFVTKVICFFYNCQCFSLKR